jgi:hypothetical protein
MEAIEQPKPLRGKADRDRLGQPNPPMTEGDVMLEYARALPPDSFTDLFVRVEA